MKGSWFVLARFLHSSILMDSSVFLGLERKPTKASETKGAKGTVAFVRVLSSGSLDSRAETREHGVPFSIRNNGRNTKTK